MPEADLPQQQQASPLDPPHPNSVTSFSLTNGSLDNHHNTSNEGDDLSLDATVNITSTDGGGLGDEVWLPGFPDFPRLICTTIE